MYADTAEEELKRNEARRPIFYLRSFSLEVWDKPTLRMLLQDDTTAEQKLVNVLNKYGPVIAIGRPGEVLPSLGAARSMSPTISGSKKSQMSGTYPASNLDDGNERWASLGIIPSS